MLNLAGVPPIGLAPLATGRLARAGGARACRPLLPSAHDARALSSAGSATLARGGAPAAGRRGPCGASAASVGTATASSFAAGGLPLLRAACRQAEARAAGRAALLALVLTGPQASLTKLTGARECETAKLPREVRDAALSAVEKLGAAVSVGDVAARSGLKPSEAEAALQAFASDTQGAIQVSAEGAVLYKLPSDLRGALASSSLLLRLEPVLGLVGSAAAYLSRVTFGVMLFVSVALVLTAVVALMLASSDDRKSSSSSRSSSRGSSYGHYRASRAGVDLASGFFDMGRTMDYFSWRRSALTGAPQELGFLESIFSFVFGDGDPNAAFAEARWKAVGAAIRRAGGVVTAEQLAPFLEPPVSARDPDSYVVDESWVLPALQRFNGSAEADGAGRLLYRFPDLQTTADASKGRVGPPPQVVLESLYKFSAAPTGKLVLAALLGAANLAGILWLGPHVYTRAAVAALGPGFAAFLQSAYPLLQVYGVAFFAIPAVRLLWNARANAAITARNDARATAADRLQAPGPQLRAKLEAAKAQSGRVVVRDADIVYSSDRSLDEQRVDNEAALFDSRLRAREQERSSSSKKAAAKPAAAAAAPAPKATPKAPAALPDPDEAAMLNFEDDDDDTGARMPQAAPAQRKGKPGRYM